MIALVHQRSRFFTGTGKAPPIVWSGTLFLILAACYLAFLPLPRVDNHLLGSDGGYYYSYMRSWYLDRDLDIRNDISLYNSRMSEENPNRLGEFYDRSIGPAVLWSPFFLAGRFLTLFLLRLGVPIAADGFSYLEEAVVCLGSILYAVAGLHLLYLTLSRFESRSISAMSVLLIFLSTFAVYYTLFEPSMSHALELFTVSFFLWSVIGRNPDARSGGVMVGIAGGLMTLVRWQNGIFLLLLPLELMSPDSVFSRKSTSRALLQVLLALLVVLVLIALQGAFWRVTLGSFVTVPQGKDFLNFADIHLFRVLFSSNHGLLSWHPVFIFAAAGMFLVRPRRRALVFSLLILVQLWVCSIVSEWWCADSFGMRRMSGTIPFFAFGIASILSRLICRPRALRYITGGIALILILWNFLFMAQYRLGLIPAGQALSLRQMTVGKTEVFPRMLEYLNKKR